MESKAFISVRYSILGDSYIIYNEPNPVAVCPAVWHRFCRNELDRRAYHRTLRIIFEVLLEVVERCRRQREQSQFDQLLGDIEVNLP